MIVEYGIVYCTIMWLCWNIPINVNRQLNKYSCPTCFLDKYSYFERTFYICWYCEKPIITCELCSIFNRDKTLVMYGEVRDIEYLHEDCERIYKVIPKIV